MLNLHKSNSKCNYKTKSLSLWLNLVQGTNRDTRVASKSHFFQATLLMYFSKSSHIMQESW